MLSLISQLRGVKSPETHILLGHQNSGSAFNKCLIDCEDFVSSYVRYVCLASAREINSGKSSRREPESPILADGSPHALNALKLYYVPVMTDSDYPGCMSLRNSWTADETELTRRDLQVHVMVAVSLILSPIFDPCNDCAREMPCMTAILLLSSKS